MTSIILTGATGNAGSAILTNALASPLISRVTVLARRAPSVQSDKLTTIILPSDEYPRGFEELPPALVERLKGHDAVVWALGISQTQVDKDEFHKITYDYTVAGASALKALGSKDKPLRFVFMSGMGVTQGPPGMFTPLFARVKGEAERALLAMESDTFTSVFVRPGGIIPSAEVRPVPISQLTAASTPRALFHSLGIRRRQLRLSLRGDHVVRARRRMPPPCQRTGMGRALRRPHYRERPPQEAGGGVPGCSELAGR
ncbi:hypothetical protein CC85DRAFT_35278 [Cutaneotrichosporon oleaginosum]|uniref:NAD(P)-binding domain-containing protein n=1 Tax=Cutaneotrichosporon oleaginosum TaxID=879819 RepID=A0A0J0XSA3_9TREE|nr:uncharacterized protein CC85DRAFT_35278 [Cutaneotrichosporon oleaginosum]KLT43937.1 hypothetical protein CC85DRAFT_35278 [Cutaneotrichosporon oleaginosum]TXT04116.1 hypothetical protein COLE_07813 [Cutaneotrichosporon oleaginosum]